VGGKIAALVARFFMRGRMGGMREDTPHQQKTTRTMLSPLLTAMAGASALMLLYAGAYLLVRTPDRDGSQELRNFNHEWEATFFTPAVKIESALRGESIEAGWWSD
jgi:hypothetical protein